MEAETIVLQVNVWLLLGLTGTGFGIGTLVIYRLLVKLSDMTIKGIHDKIDECHDELNSKIDEAHNHASRAHEKADHIQSLLIGRGLEGLEKDK